MRSDLPVFGRAVRALRPRAAARAHQPLDLLVDGARIRLEEVEGRARLTCRLPSPPADETGLRALLRSFFRHADRGSERLAATDDGTIVLVAEIDGQDDVEEAVARFCDAAAHWGVAGQKARSLSEPIRLDFGPMIIRP